MKAGEELYSIARLYFVAWLLTIGSTDYVHRHEHSIQMKNYEHPWFGNNTIRFCAFNQYLDEHEGRCMIIPGGGTAISIDDETTCEVEALRPHPSLPSSYYACRKTKTILAECRSGQRFENRLKRCAIDVTSSEDEFSDVEDSPEAYNHIHLPACERPGRFPVPQGNCTIFYACTSNGFRLFRTIYRCPPLTGFDPFTKMCSSEFACDKDSESDVELSKTEPEAKLTTLDQREAATTTRIQTFTTVAPSTIGLQETSPLVTSTPFSILDKSTVANSQLSDNSGSDTTTESIKMSSNNGFSEVETTSATLPLDSITENDVLTTTDKIIGANQLLSISTTQSYENEETTPTYEATFTPKDPRDAALATTIRTFTTAAPPTNDWQETSPLDTSTPSSVSEESTISNLRTSDNSDTDRTTKTMNSTTSGFNEVETTSATPTLNLITENEFQTTTDKIVGANLRLTMSTTQSYENEQTTSTYEATFTAKEIQTTENSSIGESSSIEEISTLNSVTSVQESTTISPNIITFTDKNYKSDATPITADTTISNNGGEDEETSIGFFTTIKPKSEESEEYLSETTSQADRITSTEKWLFDFNPTKDSTAKEASDPPNLMETLFTTSSTLLTTSAEILLEDPSTTTVESVATSVLKENADDSVTPTTEKWLFGATRAEESPTMLLTTTEIPATSVSSFIVDRKTPEVITPTTTSVAEPDVASASGEILQDNLLTTTGDWETTTSNILESAIENVVTSTTVVNDYTNEEEFLKSESSTENSSFDKNVNDDKIDSVDTSTVISETSDTEPTPIVEESSKNLVSLMTTSFRNNEVTTENSWTSNTDAGSGDSFDTTSDPSASFLPSSKPIEYNETADNYDGTTTVPTSRSDDETANSPEKELNTKGFYDETTILPEDELNTEGFNDETTILPEGELTTSRMNDEITNLSENQATTSRSDDGASELPKDDSRTISTDSVAEIPSTSSYTSTRSAEFTISTTEATELSSEVTDDVSTNTESSYSSVSPSMVFETDTTEVTYSTSESPDETETYSDMTTNVQSTTDRSLLFSTSEEPAISDDYTTSLPYTLRPLLKALKNSFDAGTPSDLTTESTTYDASNSATNSRTTPDYFETSSSTASSV